MTLSALDIAAPVMRAARRIRAAGGRVAASLRQGTGMTNLRIAQVQPWIAGAVALILIAAAGAAYFFVHRRAPKLTEKDTIVLAEFANSTGDAVCDDTLKTALNVSLRQSPFLNMLSDSGVAKTLQQMTRPTSTKLTPEVARELCQRAGSKAYLAGSIGSLGSEYVLGLKA